jgi:hypothetical protein
LNSWTFTSENLQVITRLDLKVHSSTAIALCLLLRPGGDAWNLGGLRRPGDRLAVGTALVGERTWCLGRQSTPLNWSEGRLAPGRLYGFFPSGSRRPFPLQTGDQEKQSGCKLSTQMHAVPAFDDHTADDELSVHSLPARIAEVLRNNEYRLNARGSVENENARLAT